MEASASHAPSPGRPKAQHLWSGARAVTFTSEGRNHSMCACARMWSCLSAARGPVFLSASLDIGGQQRRCSLKAAFCVLILRDHSLCVRVGVHASMSHHPFQPLFFSRTQFMSAVHKAPNFHFGFACHHSRMIRSWCSHARMQQCRGRGCAVDSRRIPRMDDCLFCTVWPRSAPLNLSLRSE